MEPLKIWISKTTTNKGLTMSVDIEMIRPVHPGEFLREEVIAANDLNVSTAAEHLGVSRQALSALLNERASLSPDMAIRIEKVFGLPLETMMRMQSNFDIACAQSRRHEISIAAFHAVVA
jgi:addiction module HigA family antidote